MVPRFLSYRTGTVALSIIHDKIPKISGVLSTKSWRAKSSCGLWEPAVGKGLKACQPGASNHVSFFGQPDC